MTRPVAREGELPFDPSARVLKPITATPRKSTHKKLTASKKNGGKGNTKAIHAQMLETVIQHLVVANFDEFKQPQFNSHKGDKPDRYYIRQAKWTWFFGAEF